MNIPINENITSGVINLVHQDNIDANSNIKILNISCDVSITYIQLKNSYPNCEIHNIEMDDYYDDNFSNIENTISVNKRDFEVNFVNSYFDYIILDDTLEKFVNPDKVLVTLKNYLKDDGYLLLSVPNFTYVNTLYSYICGNFDYTNNGVLNKDNLRFYTLNSLRNLLSSTEYDLLSITSVAVDRNETLNKIIDVICSISGPEFKDEFYSYQYIMKAKKTHIKTLREYVMD